MEAKLSGYLTAREAAEKLGYDYTHFTRLLKQGKVEGAVYWHGYAIPEDIQSESVTTRKAGRPKS